jgi:hypothetical protein
MTTTHKQATTESKAFQKGQQTKAAIVDAALGLATQIGLEGLSFGRGDAHEQVRRVCTFWVA